MVAGAVVCVLIAGLSWAGETEANLKKKVTQLEQQLHEKQAEIEELRRRNGELALQLAEAKRRCAQLEKKLPKDTKPKDTKEATDDKPVESFKNELQVGGVGTLSEKVKVLSVVSKNQLLVEARILYQEGWRDIYVKGKKTLAPTWAYHRITVWIEGHDTEGLVDGKMLKIEVPMKVSGTKKYEAIDGSTRTVFLLEPVSANGED